MGKRTNTILQSAFFKLADIMPIDEAVEYIEGRCQEELRQEGRRRCRDELQGH